MKEVVKASISGISFSLESEAFRCIEEYLDKLKRAYAGKPDGREIVADIEARLAELLLEESGDDTVVDRALAEQVVARLGFPDDVEPEAQNSVRMTRRLYRNPEGAVLGGVCTGIGAYFRIDPVWVRLLFFLPVVLALIFVMGGLDEVSETFVMLFAAMVVMYPVLWIIVPLARTPRQKLEMRGERVTASSIKRTLEDDAAAMNSATSPNQHRTASVWAEIFYAIGRVLLFCIKAVVFIIVICVCLALLGTLVGMGIVLFGGELAFGGMLFDALSGMEGVSPVWYVILMSLAGVIPLVLLVCLLFRLLFGTRTNRTFMWILLVIWVMLVSFLSVVTAHNADNIKSGLRQMEYRWEQYIDDGYDEYGPWRNDCDHCDN